MDGQAAAGDQGVQTLWIAAGEVAGCFAQNLYKGLPTLCNECHLGAGGGGQDWIPQEVNSMEVLPKYPAVQAKDPGVILRPPLCPPRLTHQ